MGPCRAHKDLVLKLSEHQVAILGRNCLWQPRKARHSIPNQQRGPVPFSTSRETRKGVWSDAPSKDEMSRECSWGSPGFTTAKESQLEKTASTQVTRCGAESEPVSGICRDEGLWSCHGVRVDTAGPVGDGASVSGHGSADTLAERPGSCCTCSVCRIQQPSL